MHLDRPSLDQQRKSLDAIIQDLDQLTSWDIRPARTVSLLSTLAEFLTLEKVDDQGRALFGDLDLPALEKLTEDWAAELDPSWIKAKQEVVQGSRAGAIPDYLGIEKVFREFMNQPDAVLAASRERLLDRVAACQACVRPKGSRVIDRVAVIFEAHPV